MRISFDLDDTLICCRLEVPREPRLSWHRRLLNSQEPLRRGAVALMRQLRHEGWELWIYTTSLRKPAAVRRWFRFHGIDIARVINQEVHQASMAKASGGAWPSKNPKAFGIDLHVDDSQGVFLEGQRFGFQVVVVSLDDGAWDTQVLCAAQAAHGSACAQC